MFFSAYLGGVAGFGAWQRRVAGHAHYLGLTSQVERRPLPGTGVLGLAWLEHESRRAERHFWETAAGIFARTFGEATASDIPAPHVTPWETLAKSPDANAVRLTASLQDGELTFIVPPTTPEQLYYTRTRDGWVFADDLRLFAGLTDAELDPCAVYALLQYGAIPPALSPYRNVRRAPNGHTVRVRCDTLAAVCTPFFLPVELPRRDGGMEEAERSIGATLDGILAPLPQDAVLYFSGGIDSGLMAARLARLGRHDVRLVTFAFDLTDEEHLLAMRMASRLGFRCEVIPFQAPGQAAAVLDRAGRDYSFPFGDISTIPTNLLIHGSLAWAGQSGTVVEGTGADGAFGLGALYPKWRGAYAVPGLIRRQVARAYGWLDLWRFDTRVERIGRFVRKSAELPLPHSVLAQNALHGIAYDAAPALRAHLAQTTTQHLDAMATGATAEDRLSLFDLIWVCAGRMAPKSFDPLRSRGIRPIYPFLEPSMVASSASLSWETKCADGVPKGILKRMLARDVPDEWVYRRKSGFTRSASARAIFASRPVQDFLHDVVLAANNPLREFCRIDVVRRLVDRARRRDSLSIGAQSFLWTFAFASAWLRPRPDARDRTAPASDAQATTLSAAG
jgi:asparagine synthetase B (glutamine-hydrolysing)